VFRGWWLRWGPGAAAAPQGGAGLSLMVYSASQVVRWTREAPAGLGRWAGRVEPWTLERRKVAARAGL
jgi:hypothetical protein